MDAVEVTAARTAAVSAACARRFAKPGWKRVGIIGFGQQAKAHLRLFAELFPDVTTCVFSRSNVRTSLEPRDTALFAPSARGAVQDADVVITAIPLEARLTPQLEAEWLSTSALVLPLDDDASLGPSVSTKAASYYVDDLEDYAIREKAGHFTGITLCLNQGMGLFDALFAHAILERADYANVGIALER
jgi:ornithine cyclodeaminase/alanine dehydrogenase-like protein (mu-crystallin family)